MTSLDAFDLQALLSTAKNNGCKIAILEASSQGLDQHRFEGVDFDVAVLTNITHDHLDFSNEYSAIKNRINSEFSQVMTVMEENGLKKCLLIKRLIMPSKHLLSSRLRRSLNT